MDPVIRRPAHLNGTRYTTYLSTMFNWTSEFREKYQNNLKTSHHLQVCASLANFTTLPRAEFVKFPAEIEPYEPYDACARQGTTPDPTKDNGALMLDHSHLLSLLFVLWVFLLEYIR